MHFLAGKTMGFCKRPTIWAPFLMLASTAVPGSEGKTYHICSFKKDDIALMMIQILLPASSEMIYSGEGWDYTKVPIPAGNFNITGSLLASTCANVGLTTPCPSPKSCYSQKMCVTTAHSAGYCTGNLFILQQKLTAQYGSTGYRKLHYSFV